VLLIAHRNGQITVLPWSALRAFAPKAS